MADLELSDDELERSLRLLERDEDDALSYLGIQAERIETNEKRAAAAKLVPEWSNQDAIDKVLSPQRADGQELARYAAKGAAFADKLLGTIGHSLRPLLCNGTEVRKELTDLESDTKALVRSVATAVVAAVLAGIPTLLAKAAVSIATTLAVILLKRQLQTFCAVGAKPKLTSG